MLTTRRLFIWLVTEHKKAREVFLSKIILRVLGAYSNNFFFYASAFDKPGYRRAFGEMSEVFSKAHVQWSFTIWIIN